MLGTFFTAWVSWHNLTCHVSCTPPVGRRRWTEENDPYKCRNANRSLSLSLSLSLTKWVVFHPKELCHSTTCLRNQNHRWQLSCWLAQHPFWKSWTEARSNGKSVLNCSETMTAVAVCTSKWVFALRLTHLWFAPMPPVTEPHGGQQGNHALHRTACMLSHSHLEVSSTSNAEAVLADALHHGLTTDFLQHQISSSEEVWRMTQVTHKLNSFWSMPSSQRTDYWVYRSLSTI